MSDTSRFSPLVTKEIGYYVYRLIDPRKGETFYVGKGKGNRVFEHVRGELSETEDELSDKLRTIRQIRLDGFEVIHVIHRHGLSEAIALEVEAALIDAYPETSNAIGGHSSDDRGLMHSAQIIQRYEAEEAIFYHDAVLINVNNSVVERSSIYEAVRYAWKLDHVRASKAEVVLAINHGLIIGAFVVEKWLEATVHNFPAYTSDRPGRWGFTGHAAPENISKLYLRHRVPNHMRKRGAANPIKYARAGSRV